MTSSRKNSKPLSFILLSTCHILLSVEWKDYELEMFWKETVTPTFKYNFRIFMDRLKKIVTTVDQDSPLPYTESNPWLRSTKK